MSNQSTHKSDSDLEYSVKAGDVKARQDNVASSSSSLLPNTASSSSSAAKRRSLLGRTFSKQNRDTAKRFFSAYAQTWVGMSPIWLMGEALTPGTKVGAQFRKGTNNLFNIAEEIGNAVSTSSQDIIVIVDETLRAGKADTAKTAEVLKAAGENAILVVSSSVEKAHSQLKQLSEEQGPKLRKSITNNGRDVIVLLDKALKNPIVITGVTKFAQSKGIPHADALLRLGSLGLAKILHVLPEDVLEDVEGIVEEIDAAELERTSSRKDNEYATRIGHECDDKEASQPVTPVDPYEKMKNNSKCIIS